MRKVSIDRSVDGMKVCSKCNIEKLLGAFSKNKSSKDGYRPDCKECRTLLWQKYKNTTDIQERQRIDHLLRTYGLTIEEYQDMYHQQQGQCAICKQHEEMQPQHYGKTLPLAVDHCHTTGAVRGLLCGACNRALGLLNEDPGRIEAMLRYVQERVLW